MKRWAVFTGQDYYPGGGMSDFLKSFDTQEEAEIVAEALREGSSFVWAEVNDMESYD